MKPDGTFTPKIPPAQLFARFAQPSTNPSIHHPITPPLHHSTPLYSIRKDCGIWRLVFNGHEAYIKHERGLFYVACLLTHPDESFHALDLMAKIPEIYRHQLGLPQLVDRSTGKVAPLLSGARLQQRSLALDDAQAMRALYKKQQELEAILDDDSESEPVKAEALRELEALYQFQARHTSRSTDAAHRAAASARKSIKRLVHRLSEIQTPQGTPHLTLRQFAAHLYQNLLLPSGSPGAAARLAYHPPPHVSWNQPARPPHP